jgi:hypothetical protein
MLLSGVPARAHRIRQRLTLRWCRHEVSLPGWLPGVGLAPVAAHDLTQLSDPRGPRGGHDQSARDQRIAHAAGTGRQSALPAGRRGRA